MTYAEFRKTAEQSSMGAVMPEQKSKPVPAKAPEPSPEQKASAKPAPSKITGGTADFLAYLRNNWGTAFGGIGGLLLGGLVGGWRGALTGSALGALGGNQYQQYDRRNGSKAGTKVNNWFNNNVELTDEQKARHSGNEGNLTYSPWGTSKV